MHFHESKQISNLVFPPWEWVLLTSVKPQQAAELTMQQTIVPNIELYTDSKNL